MNPRVLHGDFQSPLPPRNVHLESGPRLESDTNVEHPLSSQVRSTFCVSHADQPPHRHESQGQRLSPTLGLRRVQRRRPPDQLGFDFRCALEKYGVYGTEERRKRCQPCIERILVA